MDISFVLLRWEVRFVRSRIPFGTSVACREERALRILLQEVHRSMWSSTLLAGSQKHFEGTYCRHISKREYAGLFPHLADEESCSPVSLLFSCGKYWKEAAYLLIRKHRKWVSISFLLIEICLSDLDIIIVMQCCLNCCCWHCSQGEFKRNQMSQVLHTCVDLVNPELHSSKNWLQNL